MKTHGAMRHSCGMSSGGSRRSCTCGSRPPPAGTQPRPRIATAACAPLPARPAAPRTCSPRSPPAPPPGRHGRQVPVEPSMTQGASAYLAPGYASGSGVCMARCSVAVADCRRCCCPTGQRDDHGGAHGGAAPGGQQPEGVPPAAEGAGGAAGAATPRYRLRLPTLPDLACPSHSHLA